MTTLGPPPAGGPATGVAWVALDDVSSAALEVEYDGLGWVPATDRTWLVLGLDLLPSTFRWSLDRHGDATAYAVDRQRGSVSVGGEEAWVLSEDPLGPSGWYSPPASVVRWSWSFM